MIKRIAINDHEFGAKFLESLKETGFAVVTDTKLNREVLNRSYEVWKQYFLLHDSIKEAHKADFSKSKQDGYFSFKSENAKDSKVADLKEFYHFYNDSTLPAPGNHSLKTLFSQLNEIGIDLLHILDKELPQDIYGKLSTDLQNMAEKSPMTLLRAIHYPSVIDEDVASGAVRSAAHEDINLITLLPAATESGLQVLDNNGEWHTVVAEGNDIIVNVGDMLQLATNGYLKSTTHRVINPVGGRNVARYSMPFFVHPWSEVKLSKDKTAKQYLDERLAEIGLKK